MSSAADRLLLRLLEKFERVFNHDVSEIGSFVGRTDSDAVRLIAINGSFTNTERAAIVAWLYQRIDQIIDLGNFEASSLALEIKQSLDIAAGMTDAKRIIDVGFRPTICLFTVLPVETRAVWTAFHEPDETMDFFKGTNFTYLKARAGSSGVNNTIVVSSEEGQVSASSRAERVLNAFPSLRYVLNVGICGGFPNYESCKGHVRPGDICLANERGILEFDRAHRGDIKSPAIYVSNLFREIAKNILTKHSEPELFLNKEESDIFRSLRSNSDQLFQYSGAGTPIQVNHPPGSDGTRITYHSGYFGSSNGLLTDVNIRETLRNRGVFCADMESAAIARVCNDYKKDFFLVRAAVDYCCPQKNKSWHAMSSTLAARFAKTILDELLENESRV